MARNVVVLARAVRANQSHNIALLHLERDASHAVIAP